MKKKVRILRGKISVLVNRDPTFVRQNSRILEARNVHTRHRKPVLEHKKINLFVKEPRYHLGIKNAESGR